MTRAGHRAHAFYLLLALGMMPCAGVAATDFDVRIRGASFHFEGQPELGYLVQSRSDVSAVDAIERATTDAPPDDVRSVRGRGRQDLAVVHAGRTRSENEEAMERLSRDDQIAYVAPLFLVNNETICVPPEILVRVTDASQAESLRDLCETLGLIVSEQLDFTNCEYLLEVPATGPDAVFAAVEDIRQAACVEWAVPNIGFKPRPRGMVVPDDVYFSHQWHLCNTGQSGGAIGADIRAPEAWEITAGSPDIVVAVIDDGVDLDHPDLADNLVAGYDFYDDDSLPDAGTAYAIEAHGTACAGLIAAQGNNAIGVTGVAWQCRIMPVRIFGGEDGYITEHEIATAIRWAAVNGADVLSNSWGGELMTDAVHSAVVDVTESGGLGRDGKGCVVVWAVADSGAEISPYDSAAFDEVIAVGATDHSDALWDYSAYGSELDLVAPSGETVTWGAKLDLWTTDVASHAGYSCHNNRTYISSDYTDQMGGTSGACPVVAGVAALVLSVNPQLTGAQVRHVLECSALDLGTPGRDDYYGYGRIDARAAIEIALMTQSDLNLDGCVDLQDFALLSETVTAE